jgi:uncharacterized protein (TIGR03084 family)
MGRLAVARYRDAVADPSPTPYTELLVDLRAEHDDLDGMLAPLAQDDDGRSSRRGDDWDRPTPATGWTVRDQVSHLAFFDDVACTAMTDPERFASMAQRAMSSEDDPMAEHLRRGRSMSGPEVLRWWRCARSEMIDAAVELDPGSRIPWFGPPMGAMSFVSARLMETWAHGQDVADTLGVRRVPTRRLRHVAHLGVGARPYSYIVRGLEPSSAPVRVELLAPDDELWTWGGEAEQLVRGSALEFCLVVTQRRNLSDTSLETIGDDASTWMTIAQAFAGPAGPGRPPLPVDVPGGR